MKIYLKSDMKKNSKNKEVKTQDVMYSPIYQPVALRRHVLLSQIDLVQLQEKYEVFKKIRNDKRRLMSGIRHKVNELDDYIKEFKRRIPKIEKDNLNKEQEPKKIKEIKIAKPVIPKTPSNLKNQSSDINLKKELNELQEKIKRLNI